MYHCLEKIDLRQIAEKKKEGVPALLIYHRDDDFYGVYVLLFSGYINPQGRDRIVGWSRFGLHQKKREFEDDLTAIDMGTGCGSIAISFAMHSDNTKILATDISASAIEITQKNVNKFNCP